tara:strand:- start:1147 stop:2229 length:1083 start_codon:yes stop_codon:yes gene_type:complete
MSARTLAPQILTSRRLKQAARTAHALRRRLTGRKPVVMAFLQSGDSASDLLNAALEKIAAAYPVTVQRYRVGSPDKSAAPEPERLAAFIARDTQALADIHDLSPIPVPSDLPPGEDLRQRLGHYSSAAIAFEGEWYTGVERLHYLEERLGAQAGTCLFEPPQEAESAPPGGEIEMFLSLRSPYSYIAMMRITDLAQRWGATLKLRPVLPMVMRGLPVPREKRFYIVRDCKREADRFGLPFGRIVDPVGAGVERGLALVPLAREAGVLPAYLQSFLTGVWSQGLDVTTQGGLQGITARVGLDESSVRAALSNESWRDEMDANRRALFDLGLWGVPSFRVGNQVTWGQDRLWRVGRWLNGLT